MAFVDLILRFRINIYYFGDIDIFTLGWLPISLAQGSLGLIYTFFRYVLYEFGFVMNVE